jgi:hypothetical protein
VTDDPLAERPFSFRETKGGLVQIHCRGRLAITLRGTAALKFLDRVQGLADVEAQRLMARATGQFRFGNEKLAKARSRRI